jgi:hypothetical protein
MVFCDGNIARRGGPYPAFLYRQEEEVAEKHLSAISVREQDAR